MKSILICSNKGAFNLRLPLLLCVAILSGCNIQGNVSKLDSGFRPGLSNASDTTNDSGSTNSAPVATDSSLSTNKDVVASSNLLATDANSDVLTFSIVSNPSHGSVSITNAITGAYTYTPTADYAGSDSFTFKANDSKEDSNTATISVTVNNSATAPVASSITPAAFNEDTQSGPITLSYTDPQGDLATACTLSSLSGVTETQACSCDWAGVCTVKVTGTLNTNGAASFSYTVTAGGETSNTENATLTINPVNDAPTLTSISTLTSATEDTPFTISYATLAAAGDEADVDGDAISFRVEAVSTGTLTKGGVAVTPGSTLLSTGESLVWTPSANANGTLNAFTVKAYDGTTVSSSAIQVQVSTSAVNDAPVATAQSISTGVSTTYTSNGTTKPNLGGTDVEGSALTCAIGATASHGTATVNSDCSFSYVPTAAYTGTDAFTFTVNDGALTSAAATISILVATDLTDDDNSSTGFAGATSSVGTVWDSTNSYLRLSTTTNNAELDETWTPQWNSVVGYWKMNGANGSTTFTDSATGKVSTAGSGLQVSTAESKLGGASGQFGSSSTANLKVTGSTDFNFGTGDLTISGWVKQITSARFYFFDIGSNGAALSLTPSSGTIACYNGSWILSTNITSWNGLVWHHYVLTRVGDTWSFYLDGVLATSNTLSTTFGSTSTLTIGDYGGGGYAPNGYIDDFAVWKGVGLTATEVQTIYSRQSAKYSGSLVSRVMDYGSSTSWSGLKWLTTLPFYKELTGDANGSGSITSADSEASADYSSLVGSTGATSDDDLMSNLGGLWHMNESSWSSAGDIKDYSGNGNNGTATGSATPTVTGGVFGGAGKFSSATNGRVAFANSSALSPGTSDFSVSAWVMLISVPTIGSIYQDYGTTTANDVNLYVTATNGYPVFYIRDGSSNAATYASTTSLLDNTWHHLVGVRRGTVAELYLDGTLLGSASNASLGNVDTSGGGVPVIGRVNVSNGNYLNSYVDEVAVWRRSLHANEIKQLYRRGANRIKYQVRTCSAADCSDGAEWIGPDNTNGTYFSELYNFAPYNYDTNNCSATNLILTGSPSLLFDCFTGALSNLAPQQYFQYRAILESNDTSTNCNYGSGNTWCSPELRSVEAKP